MRICVFRSSAVVIYVVGTGQSSNCNRRKRSSLTFLQIKWHNTWIICETKNCFFLACIFYFDACERKSERMTMYLTLAHAYVVTVYLIFSRCTLLTSIIYYGKWKPTTFIYAGNNFIKRSLQITLCRRWPGFHQFLCLLLFSTCNYCKDYH